MLARHCSPKSWSSCRGRASRASCITTRATPVRARQAEAALAGGNIDAAVAALAQDLDPPDDVQAMGAVKKHLAGVLLRRVARQLAEAPA